MLTCSFTEAFKIWEDLVLAYNGINRFGGDTAEIYSYRLEQYSPLAHTHDNKEDQYKVSLEAIYSLIELLIEFKKTHECDIKVDGIDLKKWNKNLKKNMRHRYHVKIEKY